MITKEDLLLCLDTLTDDEKKKFRETLDEDTRKNRLLKETDILKDEAQSAYVEVTNIINLFRQSVEAGDTKQEVPLKQLLVDTFKEKLG